jgi:hypothetical protein
LRAYVTLEARTRELTETNSRLRTAAKERARVEEEGLCG